MSEGNRKSPHILNTSSNLLGICFVVLTSLKVLKLSAATLIDECTLGLMFLLTISCIASFLSLRTENQLKADKLETVADYVFLTALGLLLLTTLLFTFGAIK